MNAQNIELISSVCKLHCAHEDETQFTQKPQQRSGFGGDRDHTFLVYYTILITKNI